MNDTFLNINLDRDYFKNDEFVTGHISLKTRVPLLIQKIDFIFTKTRQMDVCKLESPNGPSSSGPFYTDVIYEHKFPIYDSSYYMQELSSGGHKFPFKFRLKSADSSSTTIKGVYFDHLINIDNSYIITALVYLVGATEPIYIAKKTLQVVDIPDNIVNFQTQIELSSMMCLFYKVYTLKFSLNKFFYFSGDQIYLNVSTNQYLTRKIKNIECNLYEVMTIRTPQENIVRTRYIVGGTSQKNKTDFSINFRIPSTTPSCVHEDKFSLKVLMFINICFRNISPIRVKKYVNIAKKQLLLPAEEDIDVLDGETFDEKLLMLM